MHPSSGFCRTIGFAPAWRRLPPGRRYRQQTAPRPGDVNANLAGHYRLDRPRFRPARPQRGASKEPACLPMGAGGGAFPACAFSSVDVAEAEGRRVIRMIPVGSTNESALSGVALRPALAWASDLLFCVASRRVSRTPLSVSPISGRRVRLRCLAVTIIGLIVLPDAPATQSEQV